jgi:predicted signal transduction protein with EAL and GGDEF domain
MNKEPWLEPTEQNADASPEDVSISGEIQRLRAEFQTRLLAAGLREEALRAGMIDLDGLKLIDISEIQLGDDDRIVDGRRIMAELRRTKPWLFSPASTSNAAAVPTSQPARQKQAMEMTDEEYAAARSAITKYRF